ncbi:nucleotidyl transferase AbiEii/AbiGii toxin family protein (plasmid) [Gordonia sp. 135]|uniref:nucleotidyl transferase AbiEii/AbiGii toxin family protein n=1 Tax=Gordonia sp. 135 TaxID=2676309 RepID=UPI0012BB2594|nr:nucleotidyl transferase AbiEii/AbiGii toxin family protein [Gordonia sp. 135]QGP90632.1 nucleotidyl transferase AbiEii/AbiGii toxin family protein [Gordonia sp. 135]
MAYASEEAFRAGLKARLSAEARTSRFSRDELAQTVTLQLFLARLFRSPDADQWILTGGTALQFRAPTQARPTADADLATRLDAEHMQHSLRQAAHPGPGDFGEFDITIAPTRSPGLFAGRIRYNIAGQRFSDATLDLATHREMLLPPETISPRPVLALDELDPMPVIRMQAAAEAVADKVAALYELHGTHGDSPSTRAHDLVDLVILARTQSFDAEQLRAAIRHQEQRRGLTIPVPLVLPNPTWERDYPERAAHSGLPAHLHQADAALTAANSLIEPILTGAAGHSRWDPDDGAWTSERTRSIGELLADTRAPHAAPRTPTPETSPRPSARSTERPRDHGPEL